MRAILLVVLTLLMIPAVAEAAHKHALHEKIQQHAHKKRMKKAAHAAHKQPHHLGHHHGG